MSGNSIIRILKHLWSPAVARTGALFAVFGGIAIAAQDKYTLKIPDGLAFSDFRGYENWEDVAVSQPKPG
jgi:hypothetical protein